MPRSFTGDRFSIQLTWARLGQGPGFPSKFPDVRPSAGQKAGNLERPATLPFRSARGG
jgi:hypothetical protein